MAAKGKLTKKGVPRKTTTGKGRAGKVEADQSNWRKKIQQSRIKFDDPQKQIYLREYAEHGLKGRAAAAAGVCQPTVNHHIDNDPEFADAFDTATIEYRDKFVAHATNLAYEGIEVKKYNKDGDLIEQRRDYPIRLIELELKRVEPDFRDKQSIDLNAMAGGVLVAPAELSPEEWIAQQNENNEVKEPPRSDIKKPGE